MELQGVTRFTWSYRVLRGGYRWFTGGNRGLQSITGGHKSYRGLQGIIEGYRSSRGLQGGTGDYSPRRK